MSANPISAAEAVSVALQKRFAELIATRTAEFSGRGWVFEAIDDWLANPDSDPFFLLTGGPGTGKSAIAARIAQMSAGAVPMTSFRRAAPGFLSYAHFCQAGSDATLSTQNFVQALVESLAAAYPAYLNFLLKSRSQNYSVNVTTGSVAPGGRVTGANLGLLILGSTGRPLFNDLVRAPLIALCAAEPATRIVIMVDSLDEALSIDPSNNIARLLASAGDLPPQVRFIFTARSNNQEITDLLGEPSLDLIADAPGELDEVHTYAAGRLAPFPEPQRTQAATDVAMASKGNFLYAYHVVNSLLQRGPGSAVAGKFELPETLEGVYSDFLKRELAADTARWNNVYRPLLGLIAVARGDGLTRDQLVGITDLAEDTAKDVLSACAEFLVGGENQNSYRIYHQSFREFLLSDERFGVTPAERHAAIAQWFESSYGSNWRKCKDPYALRYAAQHWADAATLSTNKRAKRTQSLLALVLDDGFQAAFEANIDDLPALRDQLSRAVQVASLNDTDDMLPWVLRAPLGLLAFNRTYLQAEAVVKLAEDGKIEEAQSRLCMFADIGENWQRAARLILCWLAFEKNPAGAAKSFDHVAENWAGDDMGKRLVKRVASVVKGGPRSNYSRLPDFDPEIGRQLVRRVSGQEFDRELLQAPVNGSLLAAFNLGDQLRPGAAQRYAAQDDAPILVCIAAHHPAEGTAMLDDYVRAHAGYNYVVYRNSSLCYVLDAIISAAENDYWVRDRLHGLVAAALTGGAVEFCEMLPMTTHLLCDSLTPTGGHAQFTNLWMRATKAVEELQNERGRDDTWGDHKRRLTALMELAESMFDHPPAVDDLRQRIRILPDGFAGFQAPACLRFADGLVTSRRDLPGDSDWALDKALAFAHHIQDYHFCARMTARCNTLRRWHAMPLAGPALAGFIDRLVNSPGDPVFAADHVVGEAFSERDKGSVQLLSIKPATNANTLDLLAEVFQRDPADFQRLNPPYELDTVLAPGTQIKVPDPGLASLLAVHLSARVLADPASTGQKATLIRSLVPTASINPTTLDTVLSYLVIASEVKNAELAAAIARESGEVMFSSVPVPIGGIGPDAVIPS